jgi:tetratricopeptide (TPR) repeat protein
MNESQKGEHNDTEDERNQKVTNGLEQEFYETFVQLENGKISAAQLLDKANQTIHDPNNKDFERVRNFIFQLLPYLKEMDESNQQLSPDAHYDEQLESDSIRRAYRLIGLSYYKSNQFDRALPWFRKAARRSRSINDWFNLCTTAAQANQLELAMHAFEQLEVLHKAARFQLVPSFWNQLYWFTVSLLNGEHYSAALEQLNRLKLAYKRARFTDVEYLKEVGLPSFEDFLSLVVTIFQRLDMNHKAIQFLRQMQDAVDNSGKNVIQQMLQKLQQP